MYEQYIKNKTILYFAKKFQVYAFCYYLMSKLTISSDYPPGYNSNYLYE